MLKKELSDFVDHKKRIEEAEDYFASINDPQHPVYIANVKRLNRYFAPLTDDRSIEPEDYLDKLLNEEKKIKKENYQNCIFTKKYLFDTKRTSRSYEYLN